MLNKVEQQAAVAETAGTAMEDEVLDKSNEVNRLRWKGSG